MIDLLSGSALAVAVTMSVGNTVGAGDDVRFRSVGRSVAGGTGDTDVTDASRTAVDVDPLHAAVRNVRHAAAPTVTIRNWNVPALLIQPPLPTRARRVPIRRIAQSDPVILMGTATPATVPTGTVPAA